ncbi:MAG: hypothetical protein BroJett003_19980 [Planctomycetota bacterium]|nr:MAG: hypothetical protein BroJett003_19980 [Planctomycetota bacterium]
MRAMFGTPMTMIVMLACVVIGIIGVTMVILSAAGRDAGSHPKSEDGSRGDGARSDASSGPARCCPRCNQFSPAYARFCAHCGYAYEPRG